MSTYNKKLPKVSQICFMNSARSKREATIVMPYKGTIPTGVSYVGWRQSSYAYSYQVQYFVRVRMNPDRQLETGAEYSKTGWKYMNSTWSGDVNTMNKCVAMDKKNRYYRYFNFAGKSLMTAGSYDRMDVVVRVRSFNKTKKQHGPWASRTLRVKCKPTVTVHKIVALADGGFQIYLNTGGWKRGDSEVILKDVRHTGASTKENKKNLIDEVGAIGTEEASGYPYAEFKGTGFNTDFHENESITLKNCVFRTCDGVDVSLDGTYTIDDISAVIDEPVITTTRNEDDASLAVMVRKSDDADDWDTSYCWLIADGERIDAVKTMDRKDEGWWMLFHPPLDTDLSLKIGIKNNLGGSFNKTYTKDTMANLKAFSSNGRVLVNYTDGTDEQPENGMFYGSKVVAMNYEVEYSTDATRPFERELPFGRTRPVAFLGEGLEKSIDVKGSIDASTDEFFKSVEYSSHKDWQEFQEHQGIVLLRLPKGITHTALCTKCSISHEDETDETRAVDLSLEEVEI